MAWYLIAIIAIALAEIVFAVVNTFPVIRDKLKGLKKHE
jgi:hypothetical protein